ncbi:MAG: ABC transporter permease [Bacteroidota bacterium]
MIWKFILKRIAYGFVVLLLVVTTISSIVYLAPVDPARLTFGQNADAASIESKRKELGLDKPLRVQLLYYLRDISPIAFHEDSPEAKAKYNYKKLFAIGEAALVVKSPYLRTSFQSGRDVKEILASAIPRTAVLAFTAIGIGLVLGILLGILAAVKQFSWFDNTAIVGSVLGYSLPSYVTAIIIAIVFGYYLADYTGLNLQGSLVGIDDYGNEVYQWKNLILPAVALGIRPVALITQLTRSAMLDVLNEDYIRTAKAKGLSRNKVIFKHALRNALNPVVTAASGWFAALLAGAFFVENVFNYNGLGWETVNALINFDLPVVLGAVIFTAIVFVVINILIDILYAFLDPRVAIGK